MKRAPPVFIIMAWVTLGSLPMQAWAAQAAADATVAQLCQQIQQMKEEGEIQASSPGFFEELGFVLDPASAVGLVRVEQKGQTPPPPDGLGHPVELFAPERQDFPTSAEQAQYDAATQSLAELARQYEEPLIPEKDLADCEARAQRIGLSDSVLTQILAQTESYLAVRNPVYEKQASAIVRNAAKLSPQIQVLDASSYMDILNQVATLGPAASVDLVFIFHGASDGSLEDLGGLMIPPSFFEQLARSKSIHGIAIYACFPDKIIDFYDESFTHLIQNGISVYLGIDQGILSGSDTLDMSYFKYFLEKYVASATNE